MTCGNKPENGKTCPVTPNPVNPILGIKILTEEPDVYIDAQMPLFWRRTYASDVAHEGLLGQGWSFDFGYRLEVLEDRIHVYDSYGKKDVFPKLSVGSKHHIPKGGMELRRTSQGYTVQVSAKVYDFVSHDNTFRLLSIKDANDNHTLPLQRRTNLSKLHLFR